ncbi:MAG: hypothetical protein HYX52_04020 [Chloroflexi bacterium]|nr:hypothetical protein [Chloroflexota bacterium]
MSNQEKGALGLLLLVPMALMFFVLPALFNVGQPGPTGAAPTPEVQGVQATPAVPAPLPTATPRVTEPRPTATTVPRAGEPTVVAVAPASGPASASSPTGSTAPTDSAVGPSLPAATPADAVAAFYQLVSQGQYAPAAGLWSARMRMEYPPTENIDRRFAATRQIRVDRMNIVSINETTGRARVAVDLTEVTDSGARQLSGTWDLVATAGGWLLDRPSF